jgi:sporulation protein YlmC with PRC-barrel domain
MAGVVQFTIGTQVRCADGECGRLSRVVVDPVAGRVTHLAVEPDHRLGLARLVPLDLVESAGDAADGILLRCTLAQFEALDSAEETQFVPGTRGFEAYGPEQILSWPYYRLGDTVMDPDQEGKVSQTVTVDTMPLGEVAIRRGSPVHATDGAIGHVQGLVIDAGSTHVTHVLHAEGHLWGRKQVAIPISTVSEVGDEITLRIGKQEVRDLPPVGLHDDEDAAAG